MGFRGEAPAAGGGIGASFNDGRITGVIDGTYQGSGDSHEVIGMVSSSSSFLPP
jgi:hypothetical protein